MAGESRRPRAGSHLNRMGRGEQTGALAARPRFDPSDGARCHIAAGRLRRYGHPVLLRRLCCMLIAAAVPACGGAAATGSVGAVFVRDNDTHALHVRDAPSGMAAREAGILPGDEILMVDGRYVRDLRSDQIRSALRGAIGSHVELTIVRGDEVRHVRVKRTEMRHAEPRVPRLETISE
jgi:hypothetical protein